VRGLEVRVESLNLGFRVPGFGFRKKAGDESLGLRV